MRTRNRTYVWKEQATFRCNSCDGEMFADEPRELIDTKWYCGSCADKKEGGMATQHIKLPESGDSQEVVVRFDNGIEVAGTLAPGISGPELMTRPFEAPVHIKSFEVRRRTAQRDELLAVLNWADRVIDEQGHPNGGTRAMPAGHPGRHRQMQEGGDSEQYAGADMGVA